ncbi:MAG: hypothetical protein WC531_03055 [Candidatus Paceibacterota bacterium]|jgi:hypothetical protein
MIHLLLLGLKVFGTIIALPVLLALIAKGREMARSKNPIRSTPPPAGGTPPPRPVATPAGKPVPWVGLTVLALIVLTVAIFGLKGLYGLKIESDRLELETVRAERTNWPVWESEVQTLTLTTSPTRVKWDTRLRGSAALQTTPIHPSEANRQIRIKSGSQEPLILRVGSGMGPPLCWGEDCYLSSVDGQPLAVTCQWLQY